MKNLLFALLTLAVPLFAVNLVDIKSFIDKNDSVNITLSFDGTFEGEIVEKRDNEAILFSLNGVKYAKKESKSIASPLISELLISPERDKTNIMVKAGANVRVSADKINGGTGIMVRAFGTNAQATPLNFNFNNAQNSQFRGYDFSNYLYVVGLLLVLLAVFWWLSRSLRRARLGGRDFRVLFQRPLDKSNKFAIFEYGSKRYTMILGTSNILLNIEDLEGFEDLNASGALNSRALGGNSSINLGANSSGNSANSGANFGNSFGNSANSANSSVNSANSSANLGENVGKNTPRAKKNDKKSFESFFEENKQKLQKLIMGEKDKG